FFAIFWFLLIRPQQKQKREREQMLAALKRGDRVVTSGGLHGTVTSLDEHKVVLRVADQVRLEFDRGAVGRVLEPQVDKNALEPLVAGALRCRRGSPVRLVPLSSDAADQSRPRPGGTIRTSALCRDR